MAIAYDNANSAKAAGAALSISFTLTVGSGSDRFLFVGVGTSSGPEAHSAVDTITFNGDSLTKKWGQSFSTFYRHEGWYMTAPDTGATLTVQVTMLGTNDELAAGAVALTGVDGTTPLDTHAVATGTSTTPSVNVSSATDDLVIDVMYGESNALTSSGQTIRCEQEGIGGGSASFGMSTAAGAASVSMSYTNSQNAVWGIGGVSINPAGASGAISGSSTLTFSTAGALTGAGALAGTTTLTFSPAGTLAGAGALSGSSSLTFTLSGSTGGESLISGSSSLTFSASGALGGSGALSGSSDLAFTPSGTMAGSGALAGSSSLTFSPSAALVGSGSMAGESSLTFTVSGTGAISGTVQASGVSTLTFTASGTLTGTSSEAPIFYSTGQLSNFWYAL